MLSIGILGLAVIMFIAYELYIINLNIMEIMKHLEKEAKE